ncbi:MAG TPA: linear amide C-N hydrolase [Kribbellaceae bacterium]|nr:linear amide C-N hydrolase [Kribbellaceae bacterium]
MTGRAAVTAVLLLAAVLTGCGHRDRAAVTPEPALTGDASATLASLRKVDDHPLWTMTYRGSYDRMKGVPQPAAPSPFGCSLFVAYGNRADPVFARNFDWDDHPALLLFTDPPDGHASVSMVDASYLGVDGDPDTAAERRALLDAPLLPFDGLNEQGLAIGMAAVPDADGGTRPERPTVGSVRIIRLVLDRAATVDEALAVFGSHNIDFDGGPPLHYLVADAHGRSAVVEFVGGELVAQRTEEPWNAAVNFTLAGSTEQARQADDRYRTATGTLRRTGGTLAARQAMDLLRAVAQGHTRWSVVYGLRSGEVHLVTGKRYDAVHDFRLAMNRPG